MIHCSTHGVDFVRHADRNFVSPLVLKPSSGDFSFLRCSNFFSSKLRPLRQDWDADVKNQMAGVGCRRTEAIWIFSQLSNWMI